MRAVIMPASYPKPDRERRNRSKPEFGWSTLPAEGRQGDPPKLPKRPSGSGPWSKSTKDAWVDLWRSPQATVWDQSGRTLHRWAVCYEDMVRHQQARNPVPASLMTELRQIEDRHGLSPKALLQLRWRIVSDDLGDGDVRPLRAVREKRPLPVDPNG